MRSIKTAISLDERLFREADDLAREMNTSRSRVFVLALEDYLRHRRKRRLVEQINAAHEDSPDAEDLRRLEGMRASHRQIVERD